MLNLLIRVLDFATPILIMILLGLFGAGILVEMGIMQRLAFLSRPIFVFTRLPEACSTAFVVSLGSAVAANGMIASFRREGSISDRETMLCAIMNSIPVYLRELLTYQVPIVIPALGMVVGGFYALVFLLTAAVKVAAVVLLSRILLDRASCSPSIAPPPKGVSLKDALTRTLQKEGRLFLRIAAIYLGVTTIVFLLQDGGYFEIFSVLPLAEIFGIPAESIVPLTTYVLSPIAGISLLGNMIHVGTISDVQAMIVLMLGSMFMLPIFAAKSLAPRYVAIFGSRLGLKIVFLSTGLSVLVRFFILIGLLAFVR